MKGSFKLLSFMVSIFMMFAILMYTVEMFQSSFGDMFSGMDSDLAEIGIEVDNPLQLLNINTYMDALTNMQDNMFKELTEVEVNPNLQEALVDPVE